jgi:hypothetical protein
MALPSSGAITFSNIDTELGYSSTAQISLNDTAVRTLFGVSSGSISMLNGYGKSNEGSYGFFFGFLADDCYSLTNMGPVRYTYSNNTVQEMGAYSTALSNAGYGAGQGASNASMGVFKLALDNKYGVYSITSNVIYNHTYTQNPPSGYYLGIAISGAYFFWSGAMGNSSVSYHTDGYGNYFGLYKISLTSLTSAPLSYLNMPYKASYNHAGGGNSSTGIMALGGTDAASPPTAGSGAGSKYTLNMTYSSETMTASSVFGYSFSQGSSTSTSSYVYFFNGNTTLISGVVALGYIHRINISNNSESINTGYAGNSWIGGNGNVLQGSNAIGNSNVAIIVNSYQSDGRKTAIYNYSNGTLQAGTTITGTTFTSGVTSYSSFGSGVSGVSV